MQDTPIREISLDTETTGFEPNDGHRMVEIGCVEMLDRVRTGKAFHAYINPQRDMPEGAFRVHGLSEEFLSDKPLFADVVDEFVEFIADAPLVIHNAAFDMKFLNYELKRAMRKELAWERAVDTLLIARRKFPGSPANLDALCKRFNIDLVKRTLHGALLDAELLAEVYLELTGGRQVGLALDVAPDVVTSASKSQANLDANTVVERPDYTALFTVSRQFAPSDAEQQAHKEMRLTLKNALWETYEDA